jgi:hypothetical protein
MSGNCSRIKRSEKCRGNLEVSKRRSEKTLVQPVECCKRKRETMKRNLIAAFFALACLATAQTTATTNFTMTPAPGGNGIILISQGSGTVTFCSAFTTIGGLGMVASVTPSGICANIGKVAAPVSAWLVSTQGSTSVYLVNATSGEIVQCAVSIGGPANSQALGSCKDLGAIPK